MEKTRWTDRLRNEVWHAGKQDGNILHSVKSRQSGLVTSCVGTAILNTLLKEIKKEGWKRQEDKEEDVNS